MKAKIPIQYLENIAPLSEKLPLDRNEEINNQYLYKYKLSS